MEGCSPARWLTDIMPLAAQFGERLSLQRDGDAARWTYEGLAVVVEWRSSGTIAAKFIERPSLDVVSSRLAGSVYESPGSGYSATRDGCKRMVADMSAFFSGAREPRFTFADAYLLEA